MTRIAVQVLNWNGKRWLDACFSALETQSEVDFEPWLIDNGSTDDSVPFVRERFPRARVLALARNLGFGTAYNRAIAATDAPLVALLNNDTVVQPGWLAHLVDDLETHPDCAAVGSKLLFLDRPAIINHAGGRLTTLGAAFDIGFGAQDGAQFDRPGETGCATGAALLLRRNAFLQVGQFDERYFAYFDDADLCWRLWLHGFTVRYAPQARVLHAYGGTSAGGRASSFRLEQCQTNRLQNMFKLLQTSSLIGMLPVSLAYDALRIGQALNAKQPLTGRALLRGLRKFWQLLPSVLHERKRIQLRRQLSDRALAEHGALVGIRAGAAEWQRLTAL